MSISRKRIIGIEELVLRKILSKVLSEKHQLLRDLRTLARFV